MSLGLRLGITGQGGAGGGVVLSDFVDNLDADPPALSFTSSGAGTATWDFDTSATPPAAGSGDIAIGTFAVVAGFNDATIDLTGHELETGYVHVRVGASNVLTSQVITVPDTETVEVDLSDLSAFTTKIDCTTPNATTIQATTQAGAQTPYIRNNTTVTAPGTYTLKFTASSIAGVDNVWVALRNFDSTATNGVVAFDVVNGDAPYSDFTVRITASGTGGYDCEVDFAVTTSDGVGTVDLGLTERDDATHRVTDPTTSDQVVIENARIIVRAP